MGSNHHQLHGKRLFAIIILNISISFGQLIGGLISGSLALISDSIHNFTDVASLIISYIANILSGKKQNLSHTFGFKRAEIIAAFINGLSLIVISFFLAYEAIERLIKPEIVDTTYVIWLSLVAIIGNGLSVILLKKEANQSLNMKSAYVHLLSDFMVSVVVLIGGIIMKYYPVYWLDPALTLIISIYLLVLSFRIVIESIHILMLFTPSNISIENIEYTICQVDKVKNIHHVHLWQLNDHDIYLEAHLEFSENIKLDEFDDICKKIEKILKSDFNVSHTMLQPEFNREDEKNLIIQD